MIRRRRGVQNRVIGQQMGRFFDSLRPQDRTDPVTVARRYGRHWWSPRRKTLRDEKKLTRSRFHLGLSVDGSGRDFAELTKRVALVTDTLLLSHDWTGGYHELGFHSRINTGQVDLPPTFHGTESNMMLDVGIDTTRYREAVAAEERDNKTTTYGMHCPDLAGLGTWILDAEPLLTAGLTWYLPSYSLGQYETIRGVRRDQPFAQTEQLQAIDYLVKDGRAVDASGAEPIKSALVRPVLRTELPFLQGIELREFSKITAGEFNSYAAFRDFLRLRLLDLDAALDDTQSEQAMVKLGLQINDEIRAMSARLDTVRRKRAVAASGAVLGSVGTVLVAVYGPALATVVAAAGVSGGVWGVINTMAEHNYRSLREDKWYYVWALARQSTTLSPR